MILSIAAAGTAAADSAPAFAGTWRGESQCAAKNTACHDEAVVFRIAALKEKPGYFSVDADKIVDGKAIHMGTLEFRFDTEAVRIICDYPQGVWRLAVVGEKIAG